MLTLSIDQKLDKTLDIIKKLEKIEYKLKTVIILSFVLCFSKYQNLSFVVKKRARDFIKEGPKAKGPQNAFFSFTRVSLSVQGHNKRFVRQTKELS